MRATIEEEIRNRSMDIRYNFLNTLDHFPCELIRTLWVLQCLDLQRDTVRDDEWTDAQMAGQSQLLSDLVEERLRALASHKKDLVELVKIRRKYDSMAQEGSKVEKRSSTPKLTIKLNLKQQVNAEKDTSKQARIRKSEVENDETYCICHNESYGAMIACDNAACPIEWFHYGCVGITKPPKGKWYCSKDCRALCENGRRLRTASQRKGKRRKVN